MKNLFSSLLLLLLVLLNPNHSYQNNRGWVENQPYAFLVDSLGSRGDWLSEEESRSLDQKAIETSQQLIRLEMQVKEMNVLADRYEKSFELIKFLYEKILGLDHLFESTQTYHDIQKLSNPHNYAAFKEIDELMKKRMKKRNDFTLPAPLESNPYVASTFSLVKAMIGGGKNEDKQKEFEKIACILDFTLRMSNDLKLIAFETEYLSDENDMLKKECETLFEECAKVVRYQRSLIQCRKVDDWASLHKLLEKKIEEINQLIRRKAADPEVLEEKIVEIKFSVHRVVDFINKYSTFAGEANRFYQKFDKMLGNYVNEAVCLDELPASYTRLKETIAVTSKKFNNTYELSEIKGSQLKALLFGTL